MKVSRTVSALGGSVGTAVVGGEEAVGAEDGGDERVGSGCVGVGLEVGTVSGSGDGSQGKVTSEEADGRPSLSDPSGDGVLRQPAAKTSSSAAMPAKQRFICLSLSMPVLP